MSTPISDLPPDVDEDSGNTLVVSKSKSGFLSKWKDYLVLFLVIVATLRVPLDFLRYRVPQQVFMLGDGPIQALLIVLAYLIVNMLTKNLSF